MANVRREYSPARWNTVHSRHDRVLDTRRCARARNGMRAVKLLPLDWIIVIASLLVCFVPALFFGKPRDRAQPNSSRRAAPCRGGSHLSAAQLL